MYVLQTRKEDTIVSMHHSNVLIYWKVFFMYLKAVVKLAQNLANPTALLLSAVTMLRHLKLHDKADRIQDAVLNTIAEGKYRTADLGGSSSTTEFTNAICDHI